jgi:hypothetical protein
MKKIAYLVGAMALVTAAPAFAAGQSITVNGSAAAQCSITGSPSVTVNNDLADASGFARANVAADVATALNGANVTAWCTGNKNAVVISRTAFVKTGGTTGGVVDGSGFANGVVYDLALSIPGGIRSDTNSDTDVDGTSDGAGQGPGAGSYTNLSVDSFGPTGNGVVLQFGQEAGSSSIATTANGGDGATTAFSGNNSNRLSAGSYKSTVTVTLSPAV